jgi:L-rhamnose isomerase/sugar isomerase
MQVEKYKIDGFNNEALADHKRRLDFVAADVANV